MKTLSKNQQVHVLNKLWVKIVEVLDKEKDYLSEVYFNLNLKEEKEHLRGKPEGIKNGLTAKEGAIYFSVKWVIDTLINGKRYSIEDVLTCRLTCIYGEVIALKYETQLREGLKDFDLKEVLTFDYAELQNTEVCKNHY